MMLELLKQLKLDEVKLEQLRSRMQNLNTDMLPRPPSVKNLVKWMGSMTGRDAALFVQLAPFLLQGIVSDDIIRAWSSLALLHRHAYQRDIVDMQEYATQMDALVLGYVRDLSLVMPNQMSKPKLHLLIHLAQQALMLGPPMLVATEVFESYNKIIRGLMFITNRREPSRDMGVHFRNHRTLRHVTGEGYYLARRPGHQGEYTWKRPGEL